MVRVGRDYMTFDAVSGIRSSVVYAFSAGLLDCLVFVEAALPFAFQPESQQLRGTLGTTFLAFLSHVYPSIASSRVMHC